MPSLANQVSFLFDSTVFCRLSLLYEYIWGFLIPEKYKKFLLHIA